MSKLLIDDKPVMVLPKLAVAIGLNEAIVLQQIHYWLITYRDANNTRHYHQGRWWVYNTKQEWKTNFPWWSENTIWRALTALRDRRVVVTSSTFNKKKYDKTLWYTIDYNKLKELEVAQDDDSLYPKWEQPVPKMGTPIPEINTETTKDLKDSPPPEGDQFLTPPKQPTEHQAMVHALEIATGMDMKIKSNAGQIVSSAKELRDAGYKPSDVEAYSTAWRKDWRYRKDGLKPSLATIKREIKRNLTPEEERAEEERKDLEIIASFGKTIEDVPEDKRHLSGEPLYNYLQAVKNFDDADRRMAAERKEFNHV